MKKPFTLISVLVCLSGISIFTFYKINSHRSFTLSKNKIPKPPIVEYDGKQEEADMEFLKTKDINLGYVPKYELLNAYLKIKTARDTLKSKKKAFSSTDFSWTERGPEADEVGPANGNDRPNNGIASGRIRAVWVDLADPLNKTVWVGGIDGGLWKTNDITAAPASWVQVNDFFSNLGVSTICQDPVNTNTMYFATGEKTANVDASRGGGIWKSTDHGSSWSLLPSTIQFWNASKIICDVFGNVYVATMGNNYGIQRSKDGGINWTNITPINLNRAVTDMKLSKTGRLHIVCGYENGRFDFNPSGYRFTDFPESVTPASWMAPVSMFPNVQYNVELAVSGNTLYALPADSRNQTPHIYKSTDGGLNWLPTVTSPPANGALNGISSGQGWYDLAIAVDPANPDNVIAGGLNCFRSNDGGVTWVNASIWVGTSGYYVHADQHAAVWNGTQVLIATDGGIFYSDDGGHSFFDRNEGLRIKQFYSCAIHPVSNNYFLAGAQDNGVHQFTSPGIGQTIEVTGGDGGFVHIDQNEPQYQFGSYVFNNYRRSYDGGYTWQYINYSNTGIFINPFDYDDINNKLYASNSKGHLLRWEDPQTGNNFTDITLKSTTGSMISAVKVSAYAPNTIFIGTNAGKVIKINNANDIAPVENDISGNIKSGLYISNIEIGTTDNNLIIATSNYGSSHVWNSTDGINWTDISGNLPNIPVRWARFYPYDDTKAIIATELGVWKTSLINGSATIWINDIGFPLVRTDMLQYRSSDGTLAAATHGRGLWTTIIPKTNSYLRFNSNYMEQPEATASKTGCRSYKDYKVDMNIDLPPSGTAVININVDASSTAIKGSDFDFTTNNDFTNQSSQIKFENGMLLSQPVTIRIYDDAEVEAQEFFVLNYQITGSSNAVPTPDSKAFKFIIDDNDSAPVPVSVSPGNVDANILNESPFKSTNQKGRMQYIFTPAELSSQGLIKGSILNSLSLNVLNKNSTKPFNAFTINLANTNISSLQFGLVNLPFTQVYSGNYITVKGTNTFNFTTSFIWDGVSSIILQCCFDNSIQIQDVGSDVVEGSNTPLISALASAFTGSANLSGSACLITAGSTSLKRIKVTFGIQNANNIETSLNQSVSNFISGNGDYYFYTTSGNILTSIKKCSNIFSCVTSKISEAGNSWQPFSTGSRSAKVFDLSIDNSPNATYNIGLYYTAAELGNVDPARIKIAASSASTASLANNSNTISLPTTYTSYGDGYVFYANTARFSKFFLIDDLITLPINVISFNGLLQDDIILQWQTINSQNIKNFIIEKSTDGISFLSIGNQSANATSLISDYKFYDRNIADKNYYRLKIISNDYKFNYSEVILIRSSSSDQKIWIQNNPVSSHIDLGLKYVPKNLIIAELFTSNGIKLFTRKTNPAKNIYLELSGLQLSKGIYILKIISDDKIYSGKIIKE